MRFLFVLARDDDGLYRGAEEVRAWVLHTMVRIWPLADRGRT